MQLIARVCLSSRWEAVHVLDAVRARPWKYHERYPLTISAIHDRTLEASNSAVYYNAATRTHTQYADRDKFAREIKALK